MTEKELSKNDRENLMKLFLSAIEKCPNALHLDVGAEQFANEIVKGASVLAKYQYNIE
jgi:hypothetical protein